MSRYIRFSNGVHPVRKGSVIELTGKRPLKVTVLGFSRESVIVRDSQDSSDLEMQLPTSDFESDFFIQ